MSDAMQNLNFAEDAQLDPEMRAEWQHHQWVILPALGRVGTEKTETKLVIK